MVSLTQWASELTGKPTPAAEPERSSPPREIISTEREAVTIHHDPQELLALKQEMETLICLTGQARLDSPIDPRLLKGHTFIHLKPVSAT